MERKLVEHGDELAIVLDRGMLEELDITLDTPLEISVEGRTITIHPAINEAGPDDIKDALERVNKRYGHMLKRLAE